MRKSLKQVMAEYGPVALTVYLVLFAGVLAGSWAAIRLGWSPSGAAGSAGTFAAAYVFTKLTQPLRIAATLALTPIVAKVHARLTSQRTEVK